MIIENNKLIVDFLGLRKCPICEDCNSYYTTPIGEFTNSSGGILYTPSQMKYHKSWDWLMTVVEKIEEVHHDKHGYMAVYISSNSCTIQGTKFRSDTTEKSSVFFYDVTLETKMKSTYEAVITFIKFYNKELK